MTVSYFFEIVFLAVAGLLPIMNPFSTAPLFASLTATLDNPTRQRQALKGCLYAYAILLIFLLLGSFIVGFFGISIAGIRVAGGLIITVIGLRMLFPDMQPATAVAVKAAEDQQIDVSLTPLAIPSLAGPGSISLVLSAAGHIKGQGSESGILIMIAVIFGISITMMIAFLVLSTAGFLVRFLGKSGIDAMTRIFGFLLVCIAMQFLMTGINDFFQILPG